MSYRSTTYYSDDQEHIVESICNFLYDNGYNCTVKRLKKPQIEKDRYISIGVCGMSFDEYSKYQEHCKSLGV